jgi:hypothetical protein
VGAEEVEIHPRTTTRTSAVPRARLRSPRLTTPVGDGRTTTRLVVGRRSAKTRLEAFGRRGTPPAMATRSPGDVAPWTVIARTTASTVELAAGTPATPVTVMSVRVPVGLVAIGARTGPTREPARASSSNRGVTEWYSPPAPRPGAVCAPTGAGAAGPMAVNARAAQIRTDRNRRGRVMDRSLPPSGTVPGSYLSSLRGGITRNQRRRWVGGPDRRSRP